MENLTTLEIGTKVKFTNGNADHLIDGTIVDFRILGINCVQYQFLEIYGDRMQHECKLWLGSGNVKEIVK